MTSLSRRSFIAAGAASLSLPTLAPMTRPATAGSNTPPIPPPRHGLGESAD